MNFVAISVILKLLEFIICLVALVVKKITDSRAQQVVKINQKFSREWGLLNNLTWSHEGNDFSIITFGGYTFITALLLILRITKQTTYELCEKLLIAFGVLFFALEGCLTYASLEYIPEDIRNNAYILGGVSFLAAIVFLIDLCSIARTITTREKTTQTEQSTTYTMETMKTSGLRKYSYEYNGKGESSREIHSENELGQYRAQKLKPWSTRSHDVNKTNVSMSGRLLPCYERGVEILDNYNHQKYPTKGNYFNTAV